MSALSKNIHLGIVVENIISPYIFLIFIYLLKNYLYLFFNTVKFFIKLTYFQRFHKYLLLNFNADKKYIYNEHKKKEMLVIWYIKFISF